MNAKHLLFSVGLLLAGSLTSLQAQIPWADEYFPRQNKVDVYGVAQYLHQTDNPAFTDASGTTRLRLEDTGLGGVGFAYHFNDFIAVHADFLFGPATFTVQPPGAPSYEFGNDAWIHSGRFNLDYNIINRRLTPFLTAGIGYQYMQVNEYFDNGYSYYNETDFTWNVGAGLRWNINNNFFIKLTGGAQWLKYQDVDNVTTQIEAFFAIGATFP